MNDSYLEYVAVPDGTAEEMIKFYVDTVNKATNESRSGISKRYGEVMEVCLSSDFKVQFKDKYFIVLEWRTTKFQTKEEFFGTEQD